MNVAQLLAALLHVFEACRLRAYPDAGGVYTIGWGHTAGVKEGDTCTKEQADAWLAEDAKPLLALVENEPLVAAAAYASFGYNCGRQALVEALEGKTDMSHWVHGKHGVELPGLVTRRALELALIKSVQKLSA